MEFVIRKATENELPLVLQFIREIAEYEKMSDQVVATEELLREWLFEKKKVSTAEEIYRIGSQIFEVLEYLHSRSVVHGDISAANVLLYLLYSGYGGKGDRLWHEELPLSGEQKEFLRKLMEPEEQFADTGEVRRLFEKNFGRN